MTRFEKFYIYLSMKMEQSVPKRRNINSDARELPGRRHETLRTRRKFEIKIYILPPLSSLISHTSLVCSFSEIWRHATLLPKVNENNLTDSYSTNKWTVLLPCIALLVGLYMLRLNRQLQYQQMDGSATVYCTPSWLLHVAG